jgi:hypothetical protein
VVATKADGDETYSDLEYGDNDKTLTFTVTT